MANWFYFDEKGKKQGPVRGRDLKQLAKNGAITPETIVENEEGNTGKAGKVQGLEFPPTNPTADSPNQSHRRIHQNKTWYYYDKNGQKQGPITSKELQTLAFAGAVVKGTAIETETGKKSVAVKVQGLQFAETPPVPILHKPIEFPIPNQTNAVPNTFDNAVVSQQQAFSDFVFLKRGNQEYGPFEFNEIQSMVQKKQLQNNDLMRANGEREWSSASSFLPSMGINVAIGVGGFLLGTLLAGVKHAVAEEPVGYSTYTALDLDGNGIADAVAADLDGDGFVDAVGFDFNEDGILDAAAFDMDGDGFVDAVAGDFDGDGLTDLAADVDGDGIMDFISGFFG
ncbi:hypothetical protein FACS1894170_11130 [Planctomycetales bacterium]|nr:hypothetical protein FACS1894170_11130 [Planctomycetales bacterium]